MESHNKNLIKGTSIFAVSSLFTAAGSILLLPIYTRLLTPSQYGIIGLLDPLIKFLPILLIFGLYAAQMRYYEDLKNKEEDLGKYLFTINIFLIIVNVVFLLFFLMPIGKISLSVLYDYNKVKYYPFIIIAIITGIIHTFLFIAKDFFVASKRYKMVATGNVARFLFSAICALILIYFFKFGALGWLLGVMFGVIIIALFFYIPYVRKFKFSFNRNDLQGSLLIGIPLATSGLLGIVLDYSDRLILAKLLPMDIVGKYSLAYASSLIITVFVVSFNSTWIPIFYTLMNTKKKNKLKIIIEKFNEYIIILVMICLLGQLFAKEVILLIFPDNYYGVIDFVPLILFGIVLAGANQFLKNFFIFYKDPAIFPPLVLTAVFINISINLIFIPVYGPIVAAISTIISFFIITLLLIFIIKIRYPKFTFEYGKVSLILLFAFNPFLFFILNLDIGLFSFFLKILYYSIFIVVVVFVLRKNIMNILFSLFPFIKTR